MPGHQHGRVGWDTGSDFPLGSLRTSCPTAAHHKSARKARPDAHLNGGTCERLRPSRGAARLRPKERITDHGRIGHRRGCGLGTVNSPSFMRSDFLLGQSGDARLLDRHGGSPGSHRSRSRHHGSHTPASPVVECASLRSCIQTARAFSIDTPILTPGDLDLRFVTGWLYPNEGSVVHLNPAGQREWGLRLDFFDPHSKRPLEWVMDSWSGPTPACPVTTHATPWWLRAVSGCATSSTTTWFTSGTFTSTTLRGRTQGQPPARTWLLAEVSVRKVR